MSTPHDVELELDRRVDEPDRVQASEVNQSLLSIPPRPTRPESRTREQLRTEYSDLTVLDLLLAGAIANTLDEVDQVAHLSLAVHGHAACYRPIFLPSGQQAASLHAHIHLWRHGGCGFTTEETPLSARLRPP